MFRNELRLIPCDLFGPVSFSQRPDRVVRLQSGWKAVGVTQKSGTSFVILQRRRWFWQPDSDPVQRVASPVAPNVQKVSRALEAGWAKVSDQASVIRAADGRG